MEVLKVKEKLIGHSRHLSKKLSRLMHFNLRCCMLFSIIILITVWITLTRFQQRNSIANSSISHRHKSRLNTCRNALRESKIIKTGSDDFAGVGDNESFIDYQFDDDEWSNETVELFQDQLGIVIESGEEGNNEAKCQHHGREFIMSSLPGPDEDNNFYEVLWQYFSLDATEHMTAIMCGSGGEKLTLKAVVTERMKERLQEVFDGLPVQTITSFPSSCYNLKYTIIVGNVSPFDLTEIAVDTPFLLDPEAKRWKEIAARWSSEKRPFWRYLLILKNSLIAEDENDCDDEHSYPLATDVLKDVQQEFLVARTILQIGTSRDNDVNFIGIYVSSDDKLPPDFYLQAMNFHRKHGGGPHIFMIICDAQILPFCRDVFEREKKSRVTKTDTRIMQKSSDAADFTLMASCNGTIVSNEMGVLHALMNGGITVVFKPELKDDPQFYVPWLISEKMHNWHVIGNNTLQ